MKNIDADFLQVWTTIRLCSILTAKPSTKIHSIGAGISFSASNMSYHTGFEFSNFSKYLH